MFQLAATYLSALSISKCDRLALDIGDTGKGGLIENYSAMVSAFLQCCDLLKIALKNDDAPINPNLFSYIQLDFSSGSCTRTTQPLQMFPNKIYAFPLALFFWGMPCPGILFCDLHTHNLFYLSGISM